MENEIKIREAFTETFIILNELSLLNILTLLLLLDKELKKILKVQIGILKKEKKLEK